MSYIGGGGGRFTGVCLLWFAIVANGAITTSSNIVPVGSLFKPASSNAMSFVGVFLLLLFNVFPVEMLLALAAAVGLAVESVKTFCSIAFTLGVADVGVLGSDS